jgi:hypothetical protein
LHRSAFETPKPLGYETGQLPPPTPAAGIQKFGKLRESGQTVRLHLVGGHPLKASGR